MFHFPYHFQNHIPNSMLCCSKKYCCHRFWQDTNASQSCRPLPGCCCPSSSQPIWDCNTDWPESNQSFCCGRFWERIARTLTNWGQKGTCRWSYTTHTEKRACCVHWRFCQVFTCKRLLNRNITKSNDLLNAQSEMSWITIKQIVFLVVILVFGGYYGAISNSRFQSSQFSSLIFQKASFRRTWHFTLFGLQVFLLRSLLAGATQCQLLTPKNMPQSKRASKRAKSSESALELPEMIHCRLLEGCTRELLRFTPSREEFGWLLGLGFCEVAPMWIATTWWGDIDDGPGGWLKCSKDFWETRLHV